MRRNQIDPTRAAIAALFADGRERTVTDVCVALKQDGKSRLAMVRNHMSQMREMGVLDREFVQGGAAIFRRADEKGGV